VYQGHAIQTGDAVAIKTIRPDLAKNDAALALFRKEAAALHNLYHEAIVRYYVFSVDPDLGSPYLAMEYVDGQPLSEVLKQGSLGFDAVRILQRRLASGLQAAHELGIVHRDVSPDNIILPAGNVARAKIIDFGIARTTLLGDGTIIGGGFAGKFNYVSPEQLGLCGGEVTPRSDIYSLGLVLAEALTGRPLDPGANQVEVIERRRKVPDLSAVDVRFRPLLERMLQPRPSDRIETMADIASYQVDSTLSNRKRWPVVASGLAAVIGLTSITLIIYLTAVRPPSEPQSLPQASHPQPLPQESHSQTPLQPLPEPQPPPQSPSDRLAAYVRNYEGGDCFLLRPVMISDTSAEIEGFGSSEAAFKKFLQDFEKANGFEPQVSLRQVADTQCPAVAFMRHVRIGLERAPKLEIQRLNLRGTEPLNGKVEGIGSRHIELLIVSDDGYAYSLRNHTRREAGSASFTFGFTPLGNKINRSDGKIARPQLVFAIASNQPLTLLATDKPIVADTLFPLLLDEVLTLGTPPDLAVKYISLED
jgi:eukaryotic-like serine/threonine-protein kinase